MKIRDLFKLQGEERLEALQNLTFMQRDEICNTVIDCNVCPFALLKNKKVYCSEASFAFRVRALLKNGYKFLTVEDIENEKNKKNN